ncbi:protein kinase C epsilon type-like [Rhinoderma darwinii]|uniref:protein kinase C epsilon type-like n=1 Tax=Rhinoderma darwinii TaxID=43563 RepID=UPI003F677ED2
MASNGHGEDGEKREEDKRKREVDSVTGFKKMTKKRRGAKDRGLEDEEPRPGSSQDPGTSSPYARLTISRFTIHQVLGRGSFGKVVLASVPGRNTYMAVKMITKRDNTDEIMRERRILLAARHCPFLCHLYAAHQSEERKPAAPTPMEHEDDATQCAVHHPHHPTRFTPPVTLPTNVNTD